MATGVMIANKRVTDRWEDFPDHHHNMYQLLLILHKLLPLLLTLPTQQPLTLLTQLLDFLQLHILLTCLFNLTQLPLLPQILLPGPLKLMELRLNWPLPLLLSVLLLQLLHLLPLLQSLKLPLHFLLLQLLPPTLMVLPSLLLVPLLEILTSIVLSKKLVPPLLPPPEES